MAKRPRWPWVPPIMLTNIFKPWNGTCVHFIFVKAKYIHVGKDDKEEVIFCDLEISRKLRKVEEKLREIKGAHDRPCAPYLYIYA